MLVDLRRLALILSALFLLSITEAARADRSMFTKADGTQFAEVAGVQCSVTYHAGDVLHHGYFPVQIALLNQGDSEVVVDVSAGQQWRSADKITKRVRLAPREQVEFEPLLRARVRAVNEYVVTFKVGGDSHVVSVGPSEWSDGGEMTVLYCGRIAPEAGAVERWAEQWSNRSSNTYTFAANTFDQLSEQWAAYSCYEWVVLHLDDAAPSPAALDAIFAWVRAGGRLVIAGSDPRTVLAERTGDMKWLTRDYQITPDGSHRFQAFHFGHGSVTLAVQPESQAELMESSRGRRAEAHEAIGAWQGRRWDPGSHATQTSGLQVVRNALEGFGELPLRGLMALLVLFAVVMGPVNFWWVKRSRKPMQLLITVPVISAVTSVGLVLFGIFSQGLDVKVSTRSFTFLDQPSRTATTAEVRTVFAGSSPGAGLRPDAGTAVFPVAIDSGSIRDQHYFTQDLTDGRVLGGDFLPVREPTDQLILSDRPTRLRLDISAVGDELEVANALGGTLEKLIVRDLIGDYHSLPRSLAPGESRRLAAADQEHLTEEWSTVIESFWDTELRSGEGIPRGTYLAEVNAEGLRDDCGVEVNEVSGRHFVFGVYAVPGGAQR